HFCFLSGGCKLLYSVMPLSLVSGPACCLSSSLFLLNLIGSSQLPTLSGYRYLRANQIGCCKGGARAYISCYPIRKTRTSILPSTSHPRAVVIGKGRACRCDQLPGAAARKVAAHRVSAGEELKRLPHQSQEIERTGLTELPCVEPAGQTEIRNELIANPITRLVRLASIAILVRKLKYAIG